MPAFKERGEFVDPSEFVAGRKYLLINRQDSDYQYIGTFIERSNDGWFRSHELAVKMNLFNHPIFKPGEVVRLWPHEYDFYDLDDVMED